MPGRDLPAVVEMPAVLPPFGGIEAFAAWVGKVLAPTLGLGRAAVAWHLHAHPSADSPACPLPCPVPLHRAAWGKVDLVLDDPGDAQRLGSWLGVLSERAAELLELAYLRAEVRAQNQARQLSEALFAITELAGSQKPMADLLAGLHAIIGGLMYAENFFVARYTPDRMGMRFIYFVDAEDHSDLHHQPYLPLAEMENSLTLAMMRSGRAQRGPSQMLANRLGLVDEAHLGPASNDWLGVPLLDGKEVVGAMVVQSYTPDRHFSEQDEHLLLYVAQHVVTSLKRREATLDLERRVEERTRELEFEVGERRRGEQLQSALYRITELAARRDSTRAFYAGLHAIIAELLDARNFYVAVLDDTSSMLQFPYSVDEHEGDREARPMGDGLTDHVLRTGETLCVTQDVALQMQAEGRIHPIGTPSACWLGVPVKADGRVVGALVVQNYTLVDCYSARDAELLGFVASQFAVAWERRLAAAALQRAYEDLEVRVAERTRELASLNASLRQNISVREGVEAQLKHQTLHDSLTGLPNRPLLLERLSTAIERYQRDQGCIYALLFLDLDRFKVINDSEGHLIGDELLKEAAHRLGECVRSPDTVARLGGDEFAVLLEEIGGVEEAMQVASRIVQTMGRPFEIDDKPLHSSASVGIAMAQSGYLSAEDVLRDADAAMYRAKGQGRQQYALFDDSLRHEALQRLELERELRRGLENREFEPWYQPIVGIVDGHVVGYEALLRWRMPDGRVRTPFEFLHAAEDAGLLGAIDWQIYEAVCRGIASLTPAKAYVSLNLSPRLLVDPEFADRFIALLAKHRVEGRRICLEVTEGTLIERTDLARAQMERLARAGLRLVLDDFGTGYSSLSYLSLFPLSGLKIDRSFALQLGPEGGGNRPIIRAIVAMANSLGFDVVSEGIETEEQRQAMYALGVRFAQGYLFGRPAPRAP